MTGRAAGDATDSLCDAVRQKLEVMPSPGDGPEYHANLAFWKDGLGCLVERYECGHHELLVKLVSVLKPLDSKIDHALWDGSVGQMRADLSYLRGLLNEAREAIEEALRV